VSFATVTLCVASQRVFTVLSVYFVIDSVRNSYLHALVIHQPLKLRFQDTGVGQKCQNFLFNCYKNFRASFMPQGVREDV
jgi:hypothetical protein